MAARRYASASRRSTCMKRARTYYHEHRPTPGSADLCFITSTPITIVHAELHANEIDIQEGPIHRTGATGTLISIYLREPVQNLSEISPYLP